MQTKKQFTSLVRIGSRLVILAAMLVMALLNSVSPAAAMPAALPRVGSVVVAAQSGTLTAGTAGSVTYLVTVTRATNQTLTADLSVTTGLPAGVTASFSPGTLNWNAGGATRTSTLTLSTTTAVPAGTSNFTVRALRTNGGGGADDATGSGTLTVLPQPVSQTITFDPLAGKMFGDPDFTVSATASSGLPVSFAAGGDCTVAGDLVHLTAAGSCTITASQPGGVGFLPAPDVAQSFAIAVGDQTISFSPLADKIIYDADFTVNAVASSGLPVTFAAAGECTVAGNLVHLTGVAGSCAITASQPGDANYNPATDVTQTFAVVAVSGIDLYAVSGSTTLPDGNIVTVWGYNSVDAPVSQPGGPTLIVNEGDTVAVILHNQLAENSAILFQGQEMVPDTIGAAPGGAKFYVFTASRPGTYLYEAGLVQNGQHQVAMGLYGALIVRPAATGQAYNDPATAYDDEAVLLLSEIDPALNASADPAAFDMRNFAPRYFLINGKAYPNTDSIPTVAGNRVLLRYLNAGMQFHSMSLMGMHQTVIANDGSALAYPHKMVAETFAPGQTIDAIAVIPATTQSGSQFALYDANLLLHNSSAANFGGMMTFLAAGTPPPPGTDTAGPATSAPSAAPNPTNGLVDVALNATVSDVNTGDSPVNAAEYFIDVIGASGTGTAMSGAFGSAVTAVSGTIPATLLDTLQSGFHTIYIHGQDSVGNWGPFGFRVLNLDKTGPATTGIVITPDHTNGTVKVALHATGDDTGFRGGANIAAAEYTIDNGTAVPMAVNIAAPIASLDASIEAATIDGLSEGVHIIAVRAQDSQGNWGAPSTINLFVDKTGPLTTIVSAAPNPSNGQIGINGTSPAVRVTASMEDVMSNIGGAEGFIDSIGADGAGFVFSASDGSLNSQSETVFADIPLTTINQLSEGSHTIYVHSKDVAGNWGGPWSTILVIDKTAPIISSIATADPNPTNATTVHFQVTFSESVNGVAAGNFTLVPGGGLTGAAITSVSGSGDSWIVTATAGSGGTLGLNLTSAAGIRDAAGNALSATGLPFVGQVYTVLSTEQLYFSTFGNTNPPGIGGTPDDADIYSWNGAAYNLVLNASGAGGLGLPTGANVDGFDWVDANHFYMSFTGQVAIPGIGNVQDEDVVYYNTGVWSLFFDGSVNGVGGTDLDAIHIVGSALYFSTDNTLVPPGAGGVGDNADIYRWNGGNSYTRMIDASAVGWSTANVDGLVWIDANHVYLSYSTDTAVSGLGAVQDEDVIYYSVGSWSVYFDGTAHGLTSGNLDIDAFDIPQTGAAPQKGTNSRR